MMTRRMGLVAVLCGLTAIVTYPQILSFRSAVHDFGDPLLNAWALCWVPHALIAQPLSLFDANIFYPQHGTLAFSETLIAPALMVAPLRALGASGIVLHNVTLFSGYVLSGLSMFALVRYLTDNDRAAIVSAVLFTITPLRAEHYPRVQLQMTYLLPLALLYTYKVIDGGPRRARHAVLLGTCLGLQFYSCVYYTVFLATLLPVMAGVYLVCRRDGKAVAIKWLSIAAITCALLVAPAAPVYLSNHHDVGDRARHDVQQGSAESRDYLRPTPSNWLYSGRAGGPAERHLFGGYVPVALAVVGVMAPPVRWLPLAAGAVLAWDVSRGLNGWSYATLNRYLLPYRALRVPARMAMLLTMIVIALAGLGCARLLASTRSIPVRNAVVLALIAGAVLESLNRPLELRAMEPGTPAVYEWLAAQPAAPVVEYPVGPLEGRSGPQDATYMYFSTNHWRPLLNGYSGFTPPVYDELLQRLATFPSDDAVAYLRGRQVRYLLVHERYYLRGGFEHDTAQLERAAGVALKATFTDVRLGRTYVYELPRSRE